MLIVVHICTCARAHPFSYLGNGWMDCAEIWCVARGSLAMHSTQNGGYLHEHTGLCHIFKNIYSLPLVQRPKGVLLVGRHLAIQALPDPHRHPCSGDAPIRHWVSGSRATDIDRGMM